MTRPIFFVLERSGPVLTSFFVVDWLGHIDHRCHGSQRSGEEVLMLLACNLSVVPIRKLRELLLAVRVVQECIEADERFRLKIRIILA